MSARFRTICRGVTRCLRPFGQDRRGASAVEFSIVAMPFIMLLLALPQMALYHMTQASLDAGIIQAADQLTNSFYASINTQTAPTPVVAATLKSQLVAKSGGLIHNDSTLSVELRKMANLSTAVVPIGNTVDANSPGDVLVLRAQATVTSVVPLIGTLTVKSAAIVRRPTPNP